MIPVIYKKPDFLDTLKYVLGKEDAAIVDTNMMGTSPHSFNEQFLNTKYTNKAVKRQCAHLIIAIAHRPDYHEHLSNSQYCYVAKEFLRDMGYLPKDEAPDATSQFVAVRHHDRSHEHLHIIASRIRLDGSLVNDSYDYFNSQVSTRRIAAQLGLEVTPTTNEAVASRLKQEYDIIAPTSPNRSKSIRAINSKHKTPTSKEIIREAIGEAIIDSPTISTFVQRLEENNIGVLPKMRGDKLLGFTYIHNDVKIAGYQVYKPYSWNKLQSEYGVTYDLKRDKGILQQARTKAISRINNQHLGNIEDLGNNKTTSSDTNNGSGDTDNSGSSPVSTDILTKINPEVCLTVTPVVENRFDKATGDSQRKVQPLQSELSESQTPRIDKPSPQELYVPQLELSFSLLQNPITPVESSIEEQLPLPQSDLVQPTPREEILCVEAQQSEKQSAIRESPPGTVNEIAIAKGRSKTIVATYSPHTSATESLDFEDYDPTQSPQLPNTPLTREEIPLPNAEQLPPEHSPPEKTLLPSHLCHLPSVITDYMLVSNSSRINGRELNASLDGDVLTVCRNEDNTPVMQIQYSEGNWYEEIPTQLTPNEIKQIESLRTFTQQALISKSQSKRGIEQ